MLTYQAEDPNPSYGHIIVRTDTIEEIPPLISDLEAFAARAVPQGEFRAKRLAFGPGGGDPIQARFSGSDPDMLRDLADEAMARLTEASDNIVTPRIDWREQELILKPVYATDRAQEAGSPATTSRRSCALRPRVSMPACTAKATGRSPSCCAPNPRITSL